MIDRALTRRNLKRLLFLLAAVVLIEVPFLLYVERMRLIENAHDLVVVSYVLHSVLAFVSLVLFGITFLLYKMPLTERSFLHRLPLHALFLILMIAAVIALFDQLTHGHITLFTVYMIGFGLLIYIKPYYNVYLFTVPFIVFISGVIAFQDDPDILRTHLINGTIIYVAVLFASTVLYRYARKDLDYQKLLELKNKELEVLSTIDPLTKLPNRRLFDRQVTYEASINRRYQHTAALLMVDIDHFKTLNDTFGHDAGDYILKTLAQIFRNHVRESDTVCRWGGEEFMFLLSHTDVAGAKVLAERLRQLIDKSSFDYAGAKLAITISIGITTLSNDKDGFEKSYKEADAALYKAKESGRNKVVIHE